MWQPDTDHEVPQYGTSQTAMLRALVDYHFASPEHGLLASLRGLTDEALVAEPGNGFWSAWHELTHAGGYKLMYARDAFGPISRYGGPEPEVPGREVGPCQVAALREWLIGCHAYFVAPLEWLTTEQLFAPVETQWHNESAFCLYTVLACHDAFHGARVRDVRRTMGTWPPR